jgi:hypothetical protein
MPGSTQSEPPVDALPTVHPADLNNDGYPNGRSSIGKRALIALVRFLIIFCIGVSAVLAWQSYGDPVREMIASSYPQLSWLAPQVEPVLEKAPNAIGLASRTTSSSGQQRPNATLDLNEVQQGIDRIATGIAFTQEQMTSSVGQIATSQQQIARSLDRIATSQEQMTRGLDRLAADQEQMTREITKLQQIEQSNSSRNAEPSPRPASASASKPVSRPASATAAKPRPRASQKPPVP